MTDSNEDRQDKKPLSIKEGFQKVGQKTGQVLKDLGKGTKGFFKDTKKNLQLTAEKIAIKRKENKAIRGEKKIESWKNSYIGQGLTRTIEGKIDSVKQDTTETLDNTKQIKEELSKIITVLEVIDYKSDNIENYISEILPKLEQSIENVENLEDYIKDRIGSKWKKLTRYWDKYKTNEISRSDFLKQGLIIIGKSFLPVFRK